MSTRDILGLAVALMFTELVNVIEGQIPSCFVLVRMGILNFELYCGYSNCEEYISGIISFCSSSINYCITYYA